MVVFTAACARSKLMETVTNLYDVQIGLWGSGDEMLTVYLKT
jgi:hypothetical protein